MITTKADKLLRSLMDAGLSLTEFTILATKILRIQHDLKLDNEDRRQRDHQRQNIRLREQNQFEQQLKDEEQRRLEGQNKLRQLGQTPIDDISSIIPNSTTIDNSDPFALPYSKHINRFKQRQKDCCLIFNIDYDLRRNQQGLERACKRAKRNIYELRAERFNRPESRSILSVETITLHNKLKEAIREINKLFEESKSDQDKRFLQELITYINQYEGDVDLLMCQMQYEPKVKETILFSPVTTDILDRMNLILHQVRTIANQISTGDHHFDDHIDEDIRENPSANLPSKVTYVIKIKTNDQISSSLTDETNVNLKIFGTFNKSPEIRLLQSINKLKWQPGQIDLFNIELNYLGDLYAIEIWHDGQFASWKVDWIEIIDDAANIYRFPIDRNFDKYSEEKKTRFIIQRDVGPVNRLPKKPIKQIKSYHQIGFVTYTVQVKTGKKPNKVTDSSVFIQLKGENGHFSEQLSTANSAFKSSVFEPDQLDTFYLVWPHLAKLNSLNLLVQSEGTRPAWFCEYIIVDDGETGEKYKFVVNQLLDASNPADPNLKRNLTITPENTDQMNTKEKDKDKPGYIMRIKTGEKGLSTESTLPSITTIFQGEKGKSDAYVLKQLENQRKLFQANQTDEFVIPSKHYIGSIKTLDMSSDAPINQWFIENIIIRDIAQGKEYVFPLYKWFPRSQEGKNSLIVQPINERKGIYKVYCRTIASELKGPDRSIKLTIQGIKGKQEVQLINPISLANTFQAGRKDEFYLEDIQSLGDLQSIQIDVTHPNIKKLGLDYIEIKDLTTNDSYRFNINRMLDAKSPKMTSKAEVIPRSEINPTATKTDAKPSPRPNFDQLTTNVPQGAKPSEKKAKQLPVNTDEDKSFSTADYSSDNDGKYFLNSFPKEFINTSEYSISNEDDNHHRQRKTDSFTISTSKDLSQSEKPTKPYNIREEIRPQGTAFSPSPLSAEEDLSLPSQTMTSSTLEHLSKEMNSLSEKNPNRQIRPGDRVKNNIRTDRSSKSSIHQYDRTVESQRSKEKNVPRKSSSRSLKQQKSKSITETSAIDSTNRMISNAPRTSKDRAETHLSSPQSEPKNASNRPTTVDIPKRRSQSASPSRAMVTDSTFDEYHSHENTDKISSVTINTTATKSDSDVHLIRKSIDSDHSLEKKSFLSPEHAKKSRKTSGNTPPHASTDNKSDHPMSSMQSKYLDKETSEVQNAPFPTNLSRLPMEFKAQERDEVSTDQSFTSKPSIISTHNSNLSNKILNIPSTKSTAIEHMSTVYEESEPSTMSLPHTNISSSPKDSRSQMKSNSILDRRKSKSSSKEKSLSSILSKSSRGSNRKKTIDAKTIISSASSMEYEFRVQIGNDSQFDPMNDPISIELMNNQGQSMIIPLMNSINNSKPFQKGQLDLFRLNIPKQFQPIKKMNLMVSQTMKDPVHIRYCELQDRQTMNTLYFPIEKWLGENNLYNIEMYLTDS